MKSFIIKSLIVPLSLCVNAMYLDSDRYNYQLNIGLSKSHIFISPSTFKFVTTFTHRGTLEGQTTKIITTNIGPEETYALTTRIRRKSRDTTRFASTTTPPATFLITSTAATMTSPSSPKASSTLKAIGCGMLNEANNGYELLRSVDSSRYSPSECLATCPPGTAYITMYTYHAMSYDCCCYPYFYKFIPVGVDNACLAIDSIDYFSGVVSTDVPGSLNSEYVFSVNPVLI